MPDIPFVPLRGEIPIWIYGFGLVVNLLLWYADDYRMCRYRKVEFWDASHLFFSGAMSAVWFIIWPMIVYLIITKRSKPEFIPHLIRSALGVKASLVWRMNEGYFRK